MLFNTLIDWASATPGFLRFAPKVVQGPNAMVVFAQVEGEDKQRVLVLSKGLSKTVTPGTPVTKLANCTVTVGANGEDQERVYIGRPLSAGIDEEEGITLDDLKAAAEEKSDLPF